MIITNNLLILLLPIVLRLCEANLSIYPRESETREVKLLDGLWNFRVIPIDGDQNIGFTQKWYSKPLDSTGSVIPMPVPASYNDITQSRYIRDYAGWAWYDRVFFVPRRWTDDKAVILRFGSVSYAAVVYVNGVNVVNHTGGHLPFQADITKQLKYGEKNLITVAVDNRLSKDTLPPGSVTFKNDTSIYPKGFYETSTNFDFFNYAGIHRSVHLYAIPQVHIDDITIFTNIKDSTTGVIDYSVVLNNGNSKDVVVDVFDKNGNPVVRNNKGVSGSLVIPDATFWWPYLTNTVVGYQYSVRFSIVESGTVIDSYYLNVGIRTVEVKQTNFLINGKPFYFRGFGKHEDANIRGKGFDNAILIKDFNLIKWIGANSFRTSHYPYSEELMDEADAQGIVVIDECPAVGLREFTDVLLKQHQLTLTELIERDKNRPSVVMWSIANEPDSNIKSAESYFQEVAAHARSLDKTRPITAAINQEFNNDLMAPTLDVLMINRYFAWYSDAGYPQTIQNRLKQDFDNWRKTYTKPIMISEYGADTVAGLHMDPPYIFSEDYQTEFLIEYHKAFDRLIAEGFFIGEHIWNFADFMTIEQITRVIGNKKGIFTRERQPKAAARLLRCRYWKLADKLNDESLDSNMYCPLR